MDVGKSPITIGVTMRYLLIAAIFFISVYQYDSAEYLDFVGSLGLIFLILTFPYSWEELRHKKASFKTLGEAKETDIATALVSFLGMLFVLINIIGDIVLTT